MQLIQWSAPPCCKFQSLPICIFVICFDHCSCRSYQWPLWSRLATFETQNLMTSQLLMYKLFHMTWLVNHSFLVRIPQWGWLMGQALKPFVMLWSTWMVHPQTVPNECHGYIILTRKLIVRSHPNAWLHNVAKLQRILLSINIITKRVHTCKCITCLSWGDLQMLVPRKFAASPHGQHPWRTNKSRVCHEKKAHPILFVSAFVSAEWSHSVLYANGIVADDMRQRQTATIHKVFPRQSLPM